MKIVCISDTHNMMERVDIPDGDVLVHAGDATGGGTVQQVTAFAAQLKALPHRHKVFVAGNHDFLFMTKGRRARKIMAEAGVVYLQDSEAMIDGVKFYGSPWQPEFCNWAFNLPRGKALAEKWALIPEGVDVLVTHGPPWGHLDAVRPVSNPLGCEMLRASVIAKRPRFHVFGHIHDGYGTKTVNETTFINASICTERYAPTNQPIVFDIEPRT